MTIPQNEGVWFFVFLLFGPPNSVQRFSNLGDDKLEIIKEVNVVFWGARVNHSETMGEILCKIYVTIEKAVMYDCGKI